MNGSYVRMQAFQQHTGIFCKEKDKALASSPEILPNASIYFSYAIFSLLPVY